MKKRMLRKSGCVCCVRLVVGPFYWTYLVYIFHPMWSALKRCMLYQLRMCLNRDITFHLRSMFIFSYLICSEYAKCTYFGKYHPILVSHSWSTAPIPLVMEKWMRLKTDAVVVLYVSEFFKYIFWVLLTFYTVTWR